MIRLSCPKCGKKLGLDDSAAGATGLCPACKTTFRVPALRKEMPPIVMAYPVTPPQPVPEEVPPAAAPPPAAPQPVPADIPVLEEADEDHEPISDAIVIEEEISDAIVVDDEVEWGRDAPREEKRKRKRRRSRDLRPPVHMQDEEENPVEKAFGFFTGSKKLGLVLIAWGLLNALAGLGVAGRIPAAGGAEALVVGGLGCGGVFLLLGLYFFLRGD
jgi:hypothetical protein